MVAKPSLTELELRSFPLPERGQAIHWDKLTGFGVRLSQGGARTFILKHRNRFYTLGRYPTITLSDARGEARRLLAEFTLGRHKPKSLPYLEAVEAFLEDKARAKKSRTVEDYRRLLTRLNFKGQIADITHDEAMRRLNRFTAPGEREHMRVAAKVFFNWARKRRYLDHNPMDGLAPTKSTPRARVLSDHELKSIWRACEERSNRKATEGGDPIIQLPANFATIVKLLILTGQRRGEIAALQTSWIDLENKTITIPAIVAKNGREHTFPVTSLSATILKNSISANGLVFTARGRTTSFNGWSKSKAALDKLSNVYGWTLHDLRRTFATKLADLHTPPHVIERLLNHTSGTISGVAAVYNRATYMPEMRAAIEAFEAHLKTILNLPA